MKKALITTLLLVFAFTVSAQDRLDKVRESFCRVVSMDYASSDEERQAFIHCSDNGRAAIDVLLMQLYLSVQLPDEEVARVMALANPDGTYQDIDYKNKQRGGWPATLHITRLYALARAYTYPQSGYYKSPELSALLHKSLDWWSTNKPVNPNWWHNEIGVPKKMASAMLLIKDELSKEEIDKAYVVLEKSQFGMTGQNKVSKAGIQLMKGLLKSDEGKVAEAVRQIAEEINVTDAEGIQKDWSFHQHGAQMQFGNYGLCFASDVSFWAEILKDTDFAFPQEKYDIVNNFVRDGLAWTFWKGRMDPSACGRQLHIDGLRGKALSFSTAAQNMGAGDMVPVGAKYFPRSDFGVYRTSGWYASIRMQSSRTIGFEYTNHENLLANFSADGVLLIMQSGEEYENIFPYWDWRMLPGVTSYEDGKPIKQSKDKAGMRNMTDNVSGSVTGNFMATSIEVDRDGLHAVKTNFFFPDMIVCLGSDIRSSNPEITRILTTMDQNKFVSEPKSGSNWVWHDNRGYISLDGQPICVETPVQEGSWENMAPVYEGLTESGRVFKAYFTHDPSKTSSYAYAVKPCAKVSAVKRAAKKAPQVILNEASVQAVKYNGVTLAYSPCGGTFTIEGQRINLSKATLTMISCGKNFRCSTM